MSDAGIRSPNVPLSSGSIDDILAHQTIDGTKTLVRSPIATLAAQVALEIQSNHDLELIAAAAADPLPMIQLLTRTADPAGTIRGASDSSPIQYFTCRVGGAAFWTPSSIFDVNV